MLIARLFEKKKNRFFFLKLHILDDVSIAVAAFKLSKTWFGPGFEPWSFVRKVN